MRVLVGKLEVGLCAAHRIGKGTATRHNHNRRTCATDDIEDGSKPHAFGKAAAKLDHDWS